MPSEIKSRGENDRKLLEKRLLLSKKSHFEIYFVESNFQYGLGIFFKCYDFLLLCVVNIFVIFHIQLYNIIYFMFSSLIIYSLSFLYIRIYPRDMLI